VTPIVSVVIVNYRSWDDVARVVRSLASSPEVASGACEILVVDNASPEPVPAALARGRAGVELLLNAENLGFSAGVNTGWRSARGRWLLLLNPDVVIGDGVLAAILERVARQEAAGAAGVVGFRLLDPDGTVQPSVGYEPSLWRSLRGLFIPRRRRKYQADRRLRTGPVPWVTGAFALVDTTLLHALGGMDEDFFLYYEEVALCRGARMLGRRVEYDPSVAITHLRPLQNRPVTAPLRVITRHSKLLYFSKHLPGWQFQVLARIVGLESRIRGAWAHLRGDRSARRAWALVGRLAHQARRGRWVMGTAVRDLAMSVEDPTSPPPASKPHQAAERRPIISR
jgi:GT2 family glycosyltransferase